MEIAIGRGGGGGSSVKVTWGSDTKASTESRMPELLPRVYTKYAKFYGFWYSKNISLEI